MAVEQQQPFGPARAQLIDQAGRALYEARSYEAAVRVTARCTVPGLADLAVVVVKGEGRDERIEVAHTDTHREPMVREMLVQSMDSISRVTAQDLKAGRQFRWVQSVSRAANRFLSRTDPRLIELLKVLEVHSLIVVPLRTGRRLRWTGRSFRTVYRSRAGGRRRPPAGEGRSPWWAGNYMIIFRLGAARLPPR